MTRNRELDCRDLSECNHAPETPITRDGAIVGWLCRCGRTVPGTGQEIDDALQPGEEGTS